MRMHLGGLEAALAVFRPARLRLASGDRRDRLERRRHLVEGRNRVHGGTLASRLWACQRAARAGPHGLDMQPIAYRETLEGVLRSPSSFYWNISKR
jgi:hypothetical protein